MNCWLCIYVSFSVSCHNCFDNMHN
uniref:Uncharacterized protein n=1 Tax=Rhizophora mucronata TaxID=61149 RepID=A0A2P2NTT8_RHIMU